MQEIIFIFVVLLIGSFAQGVSGFGFGLIAMSILPYFFTVKESTILVITLTLFITLRILSKQYKNLDWKGLIPVLSSAIVGRGVGFFILTYFGDLEILKTWLGIILLLMVIYLMWSKKIMMHSKQMTTFIAIVIGFIGGVVGGVFAVGGPFYVFYFLMVYADKGRYNANLQAVFFITSLITVLLHGINGDYGTSSILYVLVGLVAVLIGTSLGLKAFTKVSASVVRRMAILLVACSAINFIFFH
ncbi:sulfite exporter TauE/SafE family protein [Alkalihalobacillus pseudalcaliphilus]|uniref:sulfite exporter TauE/SafE family protein n=1 Tax=Alkalihalobacillus pseudalcaliphilus TaxID=79884 RepID=UPI00064DBB3C|nr:sulfite exporter TauE/SafE family protein [Alkalihalobacillus pseudalcaliphilus]KMK76481.1 hypothetical protein AB990_14960 [Alkalihalobacillus pseudalcaliphilus]